MPRFIATIQEGHVAQGRQESLARGLQAIASQSFGDDPDAPAVSWKVIPKGFGWTAGKASNTSVVFCSVPEGLPQPERVRLMTTINDFWVDSTGSKANELLVFTVSEAS